MKQQHRDHGRRRSSSGTGGGRRQRRWQRQRHRSVITRLVVRSRLSDFERRNFSGWDAAACALHPLRYQLRGAPGTVQQDSAAASGVLRVLLASPHGSRCCSGQRFRRQRARVNQLEATLLPRRGSALMIARTITNLAEFVVEDASADQLLFVLSTRTRSASPTEATCERVDRVPTSGVASGTTTQAVRAWSDSTTVL